MDLNKIIDALVESTKQTISAEVARIREELQSDQRRMIISLSKTAISRDVNKATEALEARIKAMQDKLDSFKPVAGKDGEKGADGQNGIDGQAGADGQNGIDGRDALQLDILPEIVATKSYPRGTYAQHDGGVFKASRTTDPIAGIEPHRAGWDVVLRGVSGVEVEQLNDSTLAIKTKMTGGTDHVAKFSIPVMVYKGVWTSGEYQKGETVTWGGSVWHCNEATDTKPGEGGAWTLAVKRGRDGKAEVKTAESKPVYLGAKQ